MLALASLERFSEKDSFFRKWRSFRDCLQSEWALAKEKLSNWGIIKNEWKILKFSHFRIITLWSVLKKNQVYIWIFFFLDQIDIALVISNSKLQNIQCFNRRNHFSSHYQVVTKTLETLLLTQLSQHAVWLNKSKGTKEKVNMILSSCILSAYKWTRLWSSNLELFNTLLQL